MSQHEETRIFTITPKRRSYRLPTWNRY